MKIDLTNNEKEVLEALVETMQYSESEVCFCINKAKIVRSDKGMSETLKSLERKGAILLFDDIKANGVITKDGYTFLNGECYFDSLIKLLSYYTSLKKFQFPKEEQGKIVFQKQAAKYLKKYWNNIVELKFFEDSILKDAQKYGDMVIQRIWIERIKQIFYK